MLLNCGVGKTETDSHIENKLVVAKVGGWGRDGLEVWDYQMQTIIYRMNKKQGPTVQHRELYSICYHKP